MNVLIVNENPAINAILTQILEDDDHSTRVAENLDDARDRLEDFSPDLIIIEEKVGGRSSMELIDLLDADTGIRVILLTGTKSSLPKDKPMIVSVIHKPFKSTQVLDAVRIIRDGGDPQLDATVAADQPEKKARRRHNFIKSASAKTDEQQHDDDFPIRFGKSYIVYENIPNSVYTVTKQFFPQGGDVLVVSFEREKTIKELVGKDYTKVLCVSPKAKISSNTEDIGNLGTIMSQIMEFIDNAVRPVVVIDEFTKVIAVNGINRALMFVCQIFTGASKNFTMVMSVKESEFTDKDKLLLSHYMERYEIELEKSQKEE